MKSLAIFDFDGTITNRDSFLDFLFFSHGYIKAGILILKHSGLLILMFLGLFSRSRTKEIIFSEFYKNWPREKFEQLAKKYTHHRLPAIIRPLALSRLNWHRTQGHHVVIISASFENYLKFWAEDLKVNLVATQAEIKNQIFTGKFASPNCYGHEKINRLQSQYVLNEFEYIYSYGDSRGDLVLKSISNEFHYKPFR